MADIALPPSRFDIETQTLIIGSGACGMVAALAAQEAGQQVLVIEADPVPSGSTALSAGLIPAAGTKLQHDAGIVDDPRQFARDIQAKAKNENDPILVDALAKGAALAIDWLTDELGLPFSVVTDFDYPGHTHRRMHGLPTRSGAELIDALRSACEARGIDVVCGLRAETVFADSRTIAGVRAARPDGQSETIGCRKLILACNGFGGNRQMVVEYMPDIENAVWFGHGGNRGEAVIWGTALGAETRALGAYQGHGNVAHPHGILITWATMTLGGVQVNNKGQRFWDESQGYSEAARAVLAQPGAEAFAIFDDRIADVARQFEDFKQAEAVGAVQFAETPEALARTMGLPSVALKETLDGLPCDGTDEFGRRFGPERLAPPYCGVRVTGALFHTQGGLKTDGTGRVQHKDGSPFPNLFAGGGAASGVSGNGDTGYLSGNGLLAAVVLGRAAGTAEVGDMS
ncbi:FAD-dependent oxidoreductase [Sulfitobacter sp. TSTF-M16]|uniref:FAD-dependent oxidoreductase n=1 Tax=Sulfitobacter aestuariivivens TaxID=2766981 RepID=A0A927D3U9_9RHOB|nr:FAD-dependent oxidoreductase [Sulfitobacter aestuariivivens]MBD3664535.1 FAD-dependent oxidoreductase [Sulfitobacter aestuariivivens]